MALLLNQLLKSNHLESCSWLLSSPYSWILMSIFPSTYLQHTYRSKDYHFPSRVSKLLFPYTEVTELTSLSVVTIDFLKMSVEDITFLLKLGPNSWPTLPYVIWALPASLFDLIYDSLPCSSCSSQTGLLDFAQTWSLFIFHGFFFFAFCSLFLNICRASFLISFLSMLKYSYFKKILPEMFTLSQP